MTTFLRLLEADPDQKGAALADAAARWRSGSEPDGIFQVEPSSFEQVPGSPFAYWVSERVRRLFAELPPFEGEERTVTAGLGNIRRLSVRTAAGGRWIRRPQIGEKWFPSQRAGRFAVLRGLST